MPSRLARLSLFTLLLAGAAPATIPTVDPLIRQLGDADPAVRKQAFASLGVMTRRDPRLQAQVRAALKAKEPAIAEAAAALVLGGQWFAPGDAPAARLLLIGYGQQTIEGRADILHTLLDRRLPNGATTVVRVASLDPSPEVAWLLFDRLQSPDRPLDPAVEAAIAAVAPADRPPGLTIMLARVLAARDDLAALPLVRSVVEQERKQQTASPQQFAGAVRLLAEVEARQGDAAAAIEQIRKLADQPHDADGSASPVDQLLSLQACRGPLPGLADDLKRAEVGHSENGTYALAELARRAGMPVAAGALLGAATVDRDGEDPADHAARLSDAADWLVTAAGFDAACRAYDRVAAIDTEPTRGRVLQAYLRLADLHEQAGRFGLAGDAVTRFIARQNAQQFMLNRNGQSELWTPEDQQAKAAWYFTLDALARNDPAAAAKQATIVIKSGSTDDTLFIQALPYLSLGGNSEQIDAYFDRVFERTKARLTENPGEPVWANDIAWLCAKSGRHLNEATAWAEQATQAQPNEAAFLDTLAEVRFRTGRSREAVELERRALALHPAEGTFMRKQLARFEAAAATQPAK